MGIDLAYRGRRKSTRRRVVKSPNVYLKLLVRLYEFLARKIPSSFAAVVKKRLMMSERFKSKVSLSKLTKLMNGREDNKIAVVVGTVTNDLRIQKIPKLTVCALKFTETAAKRIKESNGECLTLDQLALRCPRGSDTVLIRGPTTHREADSHFGKAPGVPHSKSKPYVRSKGRKFEKARGRRASRAYKV